MATSSMSYNGFGLSPVPLMTIDKRFNKNPNSEVVGTVFDVTLDGWIVNPETGLNGIFTEISEIKDAFSDDGQYFVVKCDSTVLFEGYPKVNSLTFGDGERNYWTSVASYQIQLEFNLEENDDENPELHTQFIQSSSESWNIEFVDEQNYHAFDAGTDVLPYQLRVTHEVGAVGIKHYNTSGGTTPWEHAKDYVNDRLGYDHGKVVATGTLNFANTGFGQYNHVRSVTIDEAGGSYNVVETWLVINEDIATFSSPAIEDFTVEARINRDEAENTFSVQGTIVGLETRDYGSTPGQFTISQSKYAAASGYWNEVKDSLRIFPRAQSVASANGITLNSDPVTKIITHAPAQGQINYSYTFDDSPSSCITGAKFEAITVTDSEPVDIFAQILVPGRLQGSILQDLRTVTDFTREVSIEVVMDRENDQDCPKDGIADFLCFGNSPDEQVRTILCKFEQDLKSRYDTVYKRQDVKTWQPREGRYSRTTAWVASDCSTNPETDVCDQTSTC